MRLLIPLLLLLLSSVAPAVAAVHIDGHIEPGEWKGARHITDFRQTVPWTGKPATLATQAWILATPRGLAVAFRCAQPPGVPRTEQYVPRDFQEQVDRVNVSVDFDGDGITGYNFAVASTGAVYDAVITNETEFDDDWDGVWQHAVSQDANGWTVEILIPWSTAPMHTGVDGKRTIGIYLDRVTAATGERDSWPMASYKHPRYLSQFKHIQVPAYSQSLLAITPYVSAVYDNVHDRSQFRKGVNVFWKPNGQFQLTGTINPGFGQVESDDLVVNFSATETYFSDKRPFFTENQGIFNFSLVDDNSSLIYTRRVGGPADNGHGIANISAAVKLNGSLGTTNYGVLAADERGTGGSDFGALRVVHDFGQRRLGMLLTRVERPWLDRTATVLGIDHHWRPTPDVTLWTNVVGTDIRQHGVSTRGAGLTFVGNQVLGGGWRQQVLMMHFDDQFQVNDFGYLGRNNFDYLHWQSRKRLTDLPTDSIYSSHAWTVRIDGLDNDNHHLRLRREMRIGRDSNLRNGGNEHIQLNIDSAAWNDLLTRGHGALFLPPSAALSYEFNTPRHGNWSWQSELDLMTGGLSGNREVGWEASIEPTWYITNAFRLHVGIDYKHVPDWLVWQHDALIGRFDQQAIELETGFHWSLTPRQELRLKLQAIGLQASARDAWIVAANGRAIPSSEPIHDFSVRNLGIQLRYRYKVAPLSYLYIVYGRGGYLQTPQSRTSTDLLSRALGLRQDEQLLIKFDYRFTP